MLTWSYLCLTQTVFQRKRQSSANFYFTFHSNSNTFNQYFFFLLSFFLSEHVNLLGTLSVTSSLCLRPEKSNSVSAFCDQLLNATKVSELSEFPLATRFMSLGNVESRILRDADMSRKIFINKSVIECGLSVGINMKCVFFSGAISWPFCHIRTDPLCKLSDSNASPHNVTISWTRNRILFSDRKACI